MEKRNYSEKSQKNQKKFKKVEKKTIKDPCAVCNGELYLDEQFSQRIGLKDDYDEIFGWMCPHCRTEYDLDGK